MSTLWKKEGAGTDADILAFTIGEDRVLDNRLIPYDIIGSLAHVKGLAKIGLMSERETTNLSAALSTLHQKWHAGEFALGPEDEDVHSAIERCLTEALGETGKKIHTGRSRNDQVLTALRLFMKAELLNAMEELAAIVQSTCKSGNQYQQVLMPGYTHMQRAMPSTLAFWYAAFAEGFADSLEAGKSLYIGLDKSPLGAAAGYGVPIPLDREYTAALMGFDRVHINAQAVQNSRGRLEAAVINWLAEVGRDVEKMAWDLLLYSSAEFGFVTIPERLCTGSSIMPQKRNADVLELLRATPSVLLACRDEAERIIAKLPSAYHRDFQLTKVPLMKALDKGHAMLVILNKAIGELAWNQEAMSQALSPEIFATHRALNLVAQGTPFREAYQQTAKELRDGNTDDWKIEKDRVVTDLNHLGAPGNPGLEQAKQKADTIQSWVSETQATLQKQWNALL
jgi:argininosuccinate lyase